MSNKRFLWILILAILSSLAPLSVQALDASTATADAAAECPLFPVPKQWTDLKSQWELNPATTAIVADRSGLTDSQKDVADYSAARLQTHIKNRFKVSVPVLSDPAENALQTVKTRLILKTVAKPDGKFNGFSIDFCEKQGVQTATVCGNDVNGTLYGADVLFDLMARNKAADAGNASLIVLKNVQINDWPSIPYRGRPHFILMQNLVPGVLDAYVRARMNYTDVRDNPTYKVNDYYPDRAAPMGFMPGVELDKTNIGKMVEQSHRRGLFVYACVAAATNKNAGGIIVGFDKLNEKNFYDDVNKTFEGLIDLGCDGLWLSFDDIGQGSNPESAIDNFLKLGKKHNMTGRKLAYTPPWGDYNVIDTPFNHKTGKIAEFNEIQWFFTRVPCEKDRQMAKEIGLKLLPAWWHNLIELRGGFTNNANIAVTLRQGAVELPKPDANADQDPNQPYSWSNYPCEVPLPAYIELQSLAAGWGAPKYDNIRDAAQNTDNVMLWCVGGGWPEEYLVTMIGNWSWAPETHDWDRMRTAIYSYVYGPEMAQTAKRFDDLMVELKSMYQLPIRICGPNKGWPCRLKDVTKRAEALKKIDELASLAKELTEKSGAGSAIDPNRLEFIYLEPMRATVEFARKMTNLDYPEQYYGELEITINDLIDNDKTAEARELLDAAKVKGLLLVDKIEKELAGLKVIDAYCKFWRERFNSMDKMIQQTKMNPEELNRDFKKILDAPKSDTFPLPVAGVDNSFAGIFAPVKTPPTLKSNETIAKEYGAEIWQLNRARCCGAFAAGTFDWDGKTYVGIGFPRHTSGAAGEYGQVRAQLPIPENFSDRGNQFLVGRLFLTDTRLDGAYTGYRFNQIFVNGKKAYQMDVTPNQLGLAEQQAGKTWIRVDLTDFARQALTEGKKTLDVRFRVVDDSPVGSFPSISFVGPVQLIVK